jgi:hypothetical protein
LFSRDVSGEDPHGPTSSGGSVVKFRDTEPDTLFQPVKEPLNRLEPRGHELDVRGDHGHERGA